ncbi:MAG: (Fe-S)-binding protein [Halanaeroarchaeum sp.]
MSQGYVRVDNETWDRVNEVTDGAANECFQCGTCTATCPFGKFGDEPLSIRNLVRKAQVGQDALGDADELYQCLTCRACESQCPRDVDIVDAMLGLRELSFEDDGAPAELENALWSVYEQDNPWERPASDRDEWLDAVPDDVDVQVGGQAEVLYFVGCSPSYDPQLRETPVGIVTLLDAAGVDFTVLGDQETCCGDVVRQTGETEFFDELAGLNSNQFAETGADLIITSSPHCADTFASTYDMDAEVRHYSEYFLELVEEGHLELGSVDGEVTYHDPCYLVRGSESIVDEPRELLSEVNIQVTEMTNSGDDALCCGGGGGNMWLESDGESRLADRRAREAEETGAEELVTACPYCVQNLEDGVKKEGSDLAVRDLVTVLLEAYRSKGGS